MFEYAEEGKVIVVTLHDNLDEVTSPKLQTYIKALIKEGHVFIVLDMKEVDFAASSGLGTLCEMSNRLQELSGWLRLARVNQEFKEVLSFVMLSDVLSFYETVAEAITAP